MWRCVYLWYYYLPFDIFCVLRYGSYFWEALLRYEYMLHAGNVKDEFDCGLLFYYL